MHGSFRPPIAQQRVALFGHFSQALPASAAVLTGDHPDIAGYLIGMAKAAGIAEKHLGGQGRHRSHACMRECLISTVVLRLQGSGRVNRLPASPKQGSLHNSS